MSGNRYHTVGGVVIMNLGGPAASWSSWSTGRDDSRIVLVSYAAAGRTAGTYAAIVQADVILGIDVITRNEFLMYGQEFLEKAAKRKRSTLAKVMRVTMRQDTDDLEKMLVLIKVVRGRHDYQ